MKQRLCKVAWTHWTEDKWVPVSTAFINMMYDGGRIIEVYDITIDPIEEQLMSELPLPTQELKND